MKKLLSILLVFASFYSCAQSMPEMGTKVRIAEPDKTIVAEMNHVKAVSSLKPDRYYFWYYANEIHSTQGGYSGKLLDGEYDEFYTSKNLKEQGFFKRGLKNGTWKSWNEDGTLKQSILWKNGVAVTGRSSPLWKKLPFLSKSKKHTAADSIRNKKQAHKNA